MENKRGRPLEQILSFVWHWEGYFMPELLDSPEIYSHKQYLKGKYNNFFISNKKTMLMHIEYFAEMNKVYILW